MKISGKMACVAVLKAAGKPLSANDIASKVIASGIVEGLKGATPKATLSAQITSGAKRGEVFVKVGDGRPAKFELAADAPEVPEEVLAKLNDASTTAAPPIEDVTAERDGAAKPDPKPVRASKKSTSRRGARAKTTA